MKKLLQKLKLDSISTAYKNRKLLKGLQRGDFLDLTKEEILKHITSYEHAKAQFKQDIFVLRELNFKKNGFFVEFGATDGFKFSNSHLLEKRFNWNGIVAEPAKHWHEDLKANRNCYIETDCVWIDSKTVLNFNETEHKPLSTINDFSNSDRHKKRRTNGKNYDVNSISLLDLLVKYNAPKNIDYLSIDTEGSEYDILSHFDFSKYTFKVITCEHNYTKNRDKIYELLKGQGYARKYEALSKCDDWYVKM